MIYPEIIIITGCGRSGTTYLTWTLRKTMKIGFPAEPKFVVPVYHRLRRFGTLEKPTNLRRLVEMIHNDYVFWHLHNKVGVPSHPDEILNRIKDPTYTGVLYAVFELLAEKWGGYSRLGYKDPNNIVHLPLLANIFPTARFIHIIRDGRDVATSLVKQPWGPTNLYSGVSYWAQVVSKGRQDGIELGERYFEFRFEDLIQNTEHVAKTLGQFINHGHNPEQVENFLELIERTKEPDRVQTWKHKMDANQRYICEAAGGKVLQSCGYPLEYKGADDLSPLLVAYYQSKDFACRVRNFLLRKLVVVKS